jgi:hypothetical protein
VRMRNVELILYGRPYAMSSSTREDFTKIA